MHVADGMDQLFRYQRFWTLEKMRQSAPSAVSILGLIQDLQKVCQTNDWLFEDRAPFLAYKVDLLLRRHQLQGIQGTTRLRYKRYGCAPVRTQDLMVQLQEYYRLGESTGPYAYNAVASGAPINLVQLATIYQTGPGQIRYHDFDKEIRRVARLHITNEEYINLFPFGDAADLARHLGTSKYLISPSKADTRMDGIGAERSRSEGMFSSMKGRSSSPAVRPRATPSIRTLSTTGSFRRIGTSTSITSMYRCSSTSRRSMMT